jgi:transposase
MIYVGIDVAKRTHYACIASDKRGIVTQPFPFANDESGFSKLRNSFKKYRKSDVIIGLEATSVYGENLMAFLADLDYKIALINPIETAGIRKGKIRKTKTDKIDSRGICKFLANEEYRLLQPQELDLLKLRGLCRFRQNFKKSKSRLKTQLTQYLDVCFPEFHTVFSTVHGKGAYAVLMEFPSARAVSKANIVKLSNLLHNASRGKLGRDKADVLKDLAKCSIASKNCDKDFQIKQTIVQIRLIESQLSEIEDRIHTLYDELDSVIKTVPGIGAINGSMILSEIGDIKRFSKPGQLIAFAGLDPATSQSGEWQAKSTRMSKRGSPTLRYALVNAAWNVSLNNDTFNDYYNEKLAQKGRHYAALGHVAGKLTRVIHAMLKNNMAFNLP